MGKKIGDNSSFWVSYGDLMTSLFFVMLVLVIILFVYIRSQGNEYERLAELQVQLEKLENETNATQAQLKKVKELEEATKDLDSRYFEYNDEYKKFILNIPVRFQKGSSSLLDIPIEQRSQLMEVGRILHQFMKEKNKALGVDFILIVEGQASADQYRYNRELSYSRALALYQFWKDKGLDFETGNGFDGSEALVVGSGVAGKPRSGDEEGNQRFLITLINKPGLVQ